MEKDFNVAPFKVGDWVLVGGKITKVSKNLIESHATNIRDIELSPDLLEDLGFTKWLGPCSDGTYAYVLFSSEDSLLSCNLENRMMRLDDVSHNATSVRGLQHIVREYYRRFPHHDGEFKFLVRRINKYFTKMAK